MPAHHQSRRVTILAVQLPSTLVGTRVRCRNDEFMARRRPIGVARFFGALFGCLSCAPSPGPQPVLASNAGSDRNVPADRVAPAADGTSVVSSESGSESPKEPFSLESCSVEHSGPSVVVLHCGTMVLKVMRPETLDSEGLLAQLDPTEWKRQDVDLAGTTFPGAVLANHPSRLGIVVASLQEKEQRFVSCFADVPARDGDASCREALASLLIDGGLARVAFGAPSLRLADRELKIPKGCVLSAADRIRCPEAELHWRDANPACRATEASAKAGFEALLERVGKVTHSTKGCVVLGEEQTCEQYSLEPKGQPRVTILASIRGCQHPMAQCNFLSRPGAAFPEPCDQVFSGSP